MVHERALPVSELVSPLTTLLSQINLVYDIVFTETKFRLDQDEDQPIHRRRKAIGVCWCDKAAKERRENGEESMKWVIKIEIG